MVKSLSVCFGALVVILLLSSDASAHGRRAAYYAPSYDNCGSSYGGYGAAYGSYAPSYGYGGSSYAGYTSAGYGGGYDYGRPGYNPGGLGGPYSGLGVRPGLGFGGFGPRR
jgi:hypothetical protein